MKTLTPDEVTRLRETLARARSGGASLSELSSAYELASAAGLRGTSEELRAHLRRIVAEPAHHAVAGNLILGIVSGLLTHHLLN